MTETQESNVVELRPGRGAPTPLPDILEATIAARSLRHALDKTVTFRIIIEARVEE